MSKKNKKTLLRIEQRLIDIEVMVKVLYNDKHFLNDITIAPQTYDTGTPLPDSPYNISDIPDVPYNVSNTNEVRHE